MDIAFWLCLTTLKRPHPWRAKLIALGGKTSKLTETPGWTKILGSRPGTSAPWPRPLARMLRQRCRAVPKRRQPRHAEVRKPLDDALAVARKKSPEHLLQTRR
jgi:hypothetical protein